MSGHLDGPPPGPPDPPYIPGDLGAPSAEEFARRRASSEPRPENPYRTVHARMSPPGAAWDEGFAACRAAFDAVVAERDEAIEAVKVAAVHHVEKMRELRAERDAALAGLREADELLRRVDPFTGTFAMGADSEDLWRADVAAWRALPGCCDRPVPEP